MFEFRIIDTPDGNTIIDPSLKTPEESLTLTQRIEYIEMENWLDYIERQERKIKKEEERQQKIAKNPFYRFACFCGLV